MSELLEQLRQTFSDKDYRDSYSESFMNSYVAAQIKVLREQYPLTQGELAEKIGTSQPGVARFENVNYSSWKVETLRKIARALDVRLKITFEEFGTLPDEVEGFHRDRLLRAPFDRDPMFAPNLASVMRHEELGSVEGETERNDVFSRIQPQPDLGCLADIPVAKGAAGAAA